MEEVEEVNKRSKEKGSRYGKRYGFEFKLRCVKLMLEEGIAVSLLSKEVGASKDVIRRWAIAYQERGEAGLRNGVVTPGSRRKLPGPVHQKIVEIRGPGPKRMEPFDPSVLDMEIGLLDHEVKRSAGTTGLCQQYRFTVSRRELGGMVERVQRDLESSNIHRGSSGEMFRATSKKSHKDL